MGGENGGLVVRGAAAEPAAWEAALGSPPRLELTAVDAAPEREALAAASCALLDGAQPGAVALARRVHRLDPALQVAIVAPPGERARLERTILFTPGLGEVWLVEPGEVGPALLERAGEVTRRRRGYRGTRSRIEHDLAALSPQPTRRAAISDAYLAGLLLAIPDPVASVDGEGRVLTWNPAAERLLGQPRTATLGQPIAALLQASEPEALELLLQQARTGPASGELHLHAAEGTLRICEVIAFPVDAAGQHVRALLLRDVSEQRRSQAELEMQAATLQEQAAELEMLNDELQERTQALETALAARARFYANMSHELRTPINAIIGYNALLLDGILGPMQEKQLHGLQRSQRAANHLLELINDTLDLAKIEAGRIELQPEPTTFPTLLAELLDTVRSMADQHAVALSLEGPDTPHTLRTDPRRVRQILLNLLSNAIKFSQGKPVVVRWGPTASGGVTLEVSDQGSGIAPEDQQKIFDEFVQLGVDGGGTGLGLPISRALAQLLGGALSLRSAPGEGSTFRLTLPPAAPGTV